MLLDLCSCTFITECSAVVVRVCMRVCACARVHVRVCVRRFRDSLKASLDNSTSLLLAFRKLMQDLLAAAGMLSIYRF